MKTQHDHYDRLSVRLSLIISRLLAGQSLELKALANELGVSERTLQRDFQQRLIHLDLQHSSGSYRLIRRTGREHLPNIFTFILNSEISGIIPAHYQQLWVLTMLYRTWRIAIANHPNHLLSGAGRSDP